MLLISNSKLFHFWTCLVELLQCCLYGLVIIDCDIILSINVPLWIIKLVSILFAYSLQSAGPFWQLQICFPSSFFARNGTYIIFPWKSLMLSHFQTSDLKYHPITTWHLVSKNSGNLMFYILEFISKRSRTPTGELLQATYCMRACHFSYLHSYY